MLYHSIGLTLSKESTGLSKTEFDIARYRGLLEKQYGNDHDAGYTYIDPHTSESIALTPFMMKEWARAMVSQKAIEAIESKSI
jgi:hypothetical protein